MDKTEKRISWYSSILIGVMMSSPKLLALREDGILAQFWHFNLPEFLFQVGYNICFCYLLFYFDLKRSKTTNTGFKRGARNVLWFALIALICCFTGGVLQRRIFSDFQFPGIFWSGYFSRFFLSALFTGIIARIMVLIRDGKAKEKENNQLKTAYLEAELGLLKEQLNPHFLFNTLSSLSGIVKEDPEKAQLFIGHLSKIFRYSLDQSAAHVVTVRQELVMIKSYEQLLKMRFENAFQLEIAVEDDFLNCKLPHLTLQPLIENAAKHNTASLKKPLMIKISSNGHDLIVSNNLQPLNLPESGTGIGLVNLNSRFRILMHQEISIEKTMDDFIVKLPVK